MLVRMAHSGRGRLRRLAASFRKTLSTPAAPVSNRFFGPVPHWFCWAILDSRRRPGHGSTQPPNGLRHRASFPCPPSGRCRETAIAKVGPLRVCSLRHELGRNRRVAWHIPGRYGHRHGSVGHAPGGCRVLGTEKTSLGGQRKNVVRASISGEIRTLNGAEPREACHHYLRPGCTALLSFSITPADLCD